MGRSIHLYWDSQYLRKLPPCLWTTWPVGDRVFSGLALLILWGVLVTVLRWTLFTVVAAMDRPVERRVLGAFGGGVVDALWRGPVECALAD